MDCTIKQKLQFSLKWYAQYKDLASSAPVLCYTPVHQYNWIGSVACAVYQFGPQRIFSQRKGFMELTCGGLFIINPTQTHTAAMATKESIAGLVENNLVGWGRYASWWTWWTHSLQLNGWLMLRGLFSTLNVVWSVGFSWLPCFLTISGADGLLGMATETWALRSLRSILSWTIWM